MSNRRPKARTTAKDQVKETITVKRFRTDNYDQFEMLVDNRTLYEGQVRKMLVDLKGAGGWRKDMPMVVVRIHGVLYVVDGQHRLEAARRLAYDVWFDIAMDSTLTPRDFNADQKAWWLADYVTSNRALGKEDYEILESFRAKFGVGLSLAAALLRGHFGIAGSAQRRIKDGTFEVTEQAFAQQVGKLKQAVERVFPEAKNSNATVALSRFCCVPDFSETRFVEQCTKNAAMLHSCSKVTQYSEMFEEVYNHGRHKRVPLKFLADEIANGRSKGNL